uniref:peroxiredoxin family protein n=1 Tax=uncultured Draconibacterium sp. TaxID=1573823 RepID=UPI003216BF0B
MKRLLVLLFVACSVLVAAQNNVKVKTGNKAIDFKLNTIDGVEVQLSKLYSKQLVVLVVLRGWPEYQCPVCTRQVGEFVPEAEKFKQYGASVLMVYPGPSDVLLQKAKEFAEDFTFPDNFYFTIDPDYSMVNKYGLRWNVPKETAYPSTFVINKNGEVVYSKVSSTHGGRAAVEEVLEVLAK